jgi:hypothetical protein
MVATTPVTIRAIIRGTTAAMLTRTSACTLGGGPVIQVGTEVRVGTAVGPVILVGAAQGGVVQVGVVAGESAVAGAQVGWVCGRAAVGLIPRGAGAGAAEEFPERETKYHNFSKRSLEPTLRGAVTV